ncbi:SusD/RagB family nutrient-binding outer membrane lipoprotein [Chitinophaga rhizophila]|uniref:SusD/RagB family nutrient-binding outer membrane lipoprotein n=1 Tax=Chitinophaga rhizophila TaxID=2866212 RepID=A0ABS7GCI3_9BACT|nr:SusD/RagB family nutrient-binding outer membrane lipoprotein [Chitinophaga rhizophila]MBW8685383.1 SusD/RagB family nutrient-binding outer membrane lipoprotein [Chitinophaga rhizophila]
MKKIFAYISALVLATSCADLDSLNNDPKKALVVPGEMVFSSAEKALFDLMVSNSVNLNVFRLLSQQQSQVTYLDESRYDLASRNVPQAFWHSMYRDVLKDLEQSKVLIEGVPALSDIDQTIKDNKLAIIDITQVYAYYVLVTAFGDIPYTSAFNTSSLSPTYDDQKTVYLDLLTRLKADVEKLKTTQGSFGTQDLVYGGDVTKWIKFGNSLRLKLGLNALDETTTAAAATTAINEAASNVISSNAENFRLQYLPAQPNTNPIWIDLVQSNRADYVPANTLVTLMNNVNDPRRAFYFTTVGGAYVGGVYGSGADYEATSHINSKITAADFEGLLLDYAEVEFALAEAAARGGLTVTGTAVEHYNAGITASIRYWGGTDAQVATYLAQPTVAYATAAGTWQQKIGTQKYIALYNRGYDAWTEWRRLDYPIFNIPTGMTYANIPVRLTYPVSEQNLNQSNYESASKAIGGDLLATKLFWDKK